MPFMTPVFLKPKAGEAFTHKQLFWSRAWQKSLQEARGLFLSSSLLLLFRPRDLWHLNHVGTNGFKHGISDQIWQCNLETSKGWFPLPTLPHTENLPSLFFPRSFARSERFGCWKHWKFWKSVAPETNLSLAGKPRHGRHQSVNPNVKKSLLLPGAFGVAVARGFPGRLPAIFLSQTLVRGNLTQNFGWKTTIFSL